MSAQRNSTSLSKAMSEPEALEYVFAQYSNRDLATLSGRSYATIGTWRFNYLRDSLSPQKKAEVLQSLGFELNSERTWKSKQ
jgi:hypothetical protein